MGLASGCITMYERGGACECFVGVLSVGSNLWVFVLLCILIFNLSISWALATTTGVLRGTSCVAKVFYLHSNEEAHVFEAVCMQGAILFSKCFPKLRLQQSSAVTTRRF